ncbi:hypothetical protein RI662_10630 [Brevibacillus agri]|uniref:hypothetical protein n=1 Tax=Brevibacillus agri TaxID=51101 RepID=UPI0002A4D37C|nr:hypothetical protein [Brevibacillus agri]ELK39061.1 hypothetical protein D478_26554 [Brevibacillus agri BAB-2500]MDR9504745.1 hypothetical protein [Brevibacillus agri]
MGKAEEIFDLVWELKGLAHPKNSMVRDHASIVALIRTIRILSRNTRYQHDVERILELCKQYIPEYFDD